MLPFGLKMSLYPSISASKIWTKEAVVGLNSEVAEAMIWHVNAHFGSFHLVSGHDYYRENTGANIFLTLHLKFKVCMFNNHYLVCCSEHEYKEKICRWKYWKKQSMQNLYGKVLFFSLIVLLWNVSNICRSREHSIMNLYKNLKIISSWTILFHLYITLVLPLDFLEANNRHYMYVMSFCLSVCQESIFY